MQADEVWAYSRPVRDAYVRSGVPAERVRVVPLGFHPGFFTPEGPALSLPTQKRNRLLVVGGLLERKGADLALEAYRRVFTRADDWCLVAKDMGTQTFYVGQTLRDAYRAAQADAHGPEVLYLEDDLSDADLAALYRAGTYLLLPYRGEGFALPPLEAMACGVPPIVTAGGPTDDFLDDTMALRLPHRRRSRGEANVGPFACAGDPWQLEPDMEALCDTLRRLRDRPQDRAALVEAGLAHARAGWTWERAAALACERLLAVVAPSLPVAVPAELWSEPAPAPIASLPSPVGRKGGSKTRGRGKRAASAAPPLAEGVLRPVPEEGAGAALAEGPEASDLPADLRITRRSTLPAVARRVPEVSLCVIARDEARCIGEFLASFRPHVDEIVVVDTGSTDRTKEIAREHGARVYQMPWPYDFAAARNESLRFAVGRWILVSDCDDVLPHHQGQAIRALLKRFPKADAAFHMFIRFPAGPGQYGEEWVDHVKLFPNRAEVRYEHRIHEQVLPSLRRAGIPVHPTDLYVVHKNYDRSPAGQAKKRRRDFPLLELDLRERPDHPFTLFNFGMTYLEGTHDYEVAAHYLRRSLDRSHPNDSIFTEACAKLVQARVRLGEWEAAIQANDEGRATHPDDAHLLYQAGQLYQQVGRFDVARPALERLIGGADPPSSGNRNPGFRTYLGRHQLALLYGRMGDPAHCLQALQEVVAEFPDYHAAKIDLAFTLRTLGRAGDARALAQRIPDQESTRDDLRRLRRELGMREAA